MKAETGKLYALIDNGLVLQIFDKNDIPEWSEETITAIELSEDDKQWVQAGDYYDMEKREFVKPTLEEAKEQQLLYINNRFDSEVSALKAEYIPQDELITWEAQCAEAKAYLESKEASAAPLLGLIAQQRGQELEALCQKVVEKSNNYKTKLYTLIGYRQMQRDKIEKASSIDEVAAVSYQSPYNFV